MYVVQDLGIKDTQRERVFLVNQIVRIGHMEIKEVDLKRDTTSLRRPFGVAGTGFVIILLLVFPRIVLSL